MAAGQPPYYKNAEELKTAIEAYFKSLEHETKAEDGSVTVDIVRSPTVAGLAYALGFMDRQSIYDQKDRNEEFSCIIKRAVLYIESYHEGNLTDGKSPTGSIFWLKNHGWTDMQEIKNTGPRDPLLITFGESDGDNSNQEVFKPE